MTKLEKKIEKIMNDDKEFILIIDDVKNNESYKEDIRKNLALIINKNKKPVYFIDAVKFYDDILVYFEGQVKSYPFIIKVKDKSIIEAYNTVVKDL